jgi:tetratricopeptide (TPR) repeat protein
VLFAPTTAAVLSEIHQQEPYELARERQEADQQASDAFAGKSQDVETAITILAVALFLLGLSHTVPASWARRVFTVTGVGIAVVAGTWGLIHATGTVPPPSQAAISDYLEADADITAALDAPGDPHSQALLRAAVGKLDRAIAMRPRYANARVDRATALEQLAQVYSPVPHGSAEALGDVRDALAEAGDSSVYESVPADIAFWLRRYDEAIAAGQRAAALSPSSVAAAFNQAQYIELAPRSRAAMSNKALKQLVHDYAASPGELRSPDYQGIAFEIQSVIRYRPTLARRARAWRAHLTQLLGPAAR